MLNFVGLQSVTPKLTDELAKHVGKLDVWRVPAFPIPNFRSLVEHVARLSYANPSLLMFFRGQSQDYQSKAQGSTIYPGIYRDDNLSTAELGYRFRKLESAARTLARLFRTQGIEGARDIERKKYMQWSILQHYEVVQTPLLDITQSLRVACSFAQLRNAGSSCCVHVLGFPYPTNRISINSEEDIVNIRLLSICPPSALRPYYQEGYMAGTPDVTTTYESKTELDFRNRLVAKFQIPSDDSFWDVGFEMIPESALYPPNDRIKDLCLEIGTIANEDEASTEFGGQLLVEWGQLEEKILPLARKFTQRNVSVPDAIRLLTETGTISDEASRELNIVRRIRNATAHTPTKVTEKELNHALELLRRLTIQIGPNLIQP